jgi:hypothetical protein
MPATRNKSKSIGKKTKAVKPVLAGTSGRSEADQKFMDKLGAAEEFDFSSVVPGKTYDSLEKIMEDQPKFAAILKRELEALEH